MSQCLVSPPGPLYSRLGADPDLGFLVELFVSEIPERLEQMLADLEAANWAGLQHIAHQLKGAAGSYGFNEVTPFADLVETLASQRESEERILAAVTSLIAVCRQMRAGAPEGDSFVA
jgi:histidine phosphotransfer protein HptB